MAAVAGGLARCTPEASIAAAASTLILPRIVADAMIETLAEDVQQLADPVLRTPRRPRSRSLEFDAVGARSSAHVPPPPAKPARSACSSPTA